MARGVFEKVPGSGAWWIRYADQHGRIHREKVGPKGVAIAAYQKRKTEVREKRFFPEKFREREVSFGEIAQGALKYSKRHKVKATYDNDRWRMETLLRWFRNRKAEDITPAEIEDRLAELEADGRKPATLNRYRALLSHTYSLAIRNGKISLNPAKLVRLRKENNARVRFLYEREEALLRETIWCRFPHCEAEFDLALNTGMRRGEQFRLKWADIDFPNRLISIRQSKNGGTRHIPINSVALEALAVLRSRSDGSDYVCPGSNGERRKDWRRWFEEAVTTAGIKDFRWHDIRHTFASRLVMAGVDLRTVQELMGHKTIAMTVRYSHLAPAHQLEAVERLTAGSTSTRTDTNEVRTPEQRLAPAR